MSWGFDGSHRHARCGFEVWEILRLLNETEVLIRPSFLPKGTPLNRGYGQKFNGLTLGKIHLLAAACTPMAAVQVLTGCNLRWWSFSLAMERLYFLAHVVVQMVRVLPWSHCNLHWWSFSMTNWCRYSTGTCGSDRDIVTCTVWWLYITTYIRTYM